MEVWVRESGRQGPTATPIGRSRPPSPSEFEPPSLKTGPQGASSKTPPTLLNGSVYRVSIRHDGYLPFLSDWVTLDGERTTVAPIRLEPYRTLSGKITDRQGRAGSRTGLPGGPCSSRWRPMPKAGSRWVASSQGTPVLLLAERAGFRLRGWPVEPSAMAEMGSLTLVHMGESPELVIKPMAEAMPPEVASPCGRAAGAPLSRR